MDLSSGFTQPDLEIRTGSRLVSAKSEIGLLCGPGAEGLHHDLDVRSDRRRRLASGREPEGVEGAPRIDGGECSVVEMRPSELAAELAHLEGDVR